MADLACIEQMCVAFQKRVRVQMWLDDESIVTLESERGCFADILKTLQDCQAPMPQAVCRDIGLSEGSTYAEGVRKLTNYLETTMAEPLRRGAGVEVLLFPFNEGEHFGYRHFWDRVRSDFIEVRDRDTIDLLRYKKERYVESPEYEAMDAYTRDLAPHFIRPVQDSSTREKLQIALADQKAAPCFDAVAGFAGFSQDWDDFKFAARREFLNCWRQENEVQVELS